MSYRTHVCNWDHNLREVRAASRSLGPTPPPSDDLRTQGVPSSPEPLARRRHSPCWPAGAGSGRAGDRLLQRRPSDVAPCRAAGECRRLCVDGRHARCVSTAPGVAPCRSICYIHVPYVARRARARRQSGKYGFGATDPGEAIALCAGEAPPLHQTQVSSGVAGAAAGMSALLGLWSFCTATPPWVRVLGSLHTPEDGVTSSGAGGPTGMAGVECGGGCTCMPARFNRTVAEFSLPSLALLPVTSWSGDQNFKELKYDCMKTTHTRGHHTCPSPAAVPGPPAPRRRREEAPLTTCSPSSCRLGCLATSNTRRCLRTPCHPCSWHQRVASAFIA